MPDTSPSPTRRDRKRLQIRRALMDAGQLLFSSRAMEGVSIDEIVNAADVSKGSFYNHFDDKEQLATAIFELIQSDLEGHIQSANRDIADPPQRVVRALGVMLEYGAQHPERVQAILSLSERRTRADSPLNLGIAADVGAGIKSGRFTGVNLESGVLLVLGSFVVTMRHVATGASAEPAADLAVRMGAALLRGLGIDYQEAGDIARAVANTFASGR